jgi:hypothetical protein
VLNASPVERHEVREQRPYMVRREDHRRLRFAAVFPYHHGRILALRQRDAGDVHHRIGERAKGRETPVEVCNRDEVSHRQDKRMPTTDHVTFSWGVRYPVEQRPQPRDRHGDDLRWVIIDGTANDGDDFAGVIDHGGT